MAKKEGTQNYPVVVGGQTTPTQTGKINIPERATIGKEESEKLFKDFLSGYTMDLGSVGVYYTELDEKGNVLGRYSPIYKKDIQGITSTEFKQDCDNKYAEEIKQEIKRVSKVNER